MGIFVIILASMCLSQGATLGHSIVTRQASSSPMDAAMNAIKSLGNMVGKAIVDANELIHKYSDNTTDYAAEFRYNSRNQINEMIDNAMAETAATISASNNSALACFNMKRNDTRNMALVLFEDISRCAITKIRQITDIGFTLTDLANTTINLMPNTNLKIKLCDNEWNPISKAACITYASAEASVKLAQLAGSITSSTASATGLFLTFQSDLGYCTGAKILAFRRKLAEIPLNVGICAAKTVMG